jgi:hypothetical protein
MAVNNAQPQGSQAPFQVNAQPVKSGIITDLSWTAAVECYWAQSTARPTITDATGQTIEFQVDRFNFTVGFIY